MAPDDETGRGAGRYRQDAKSRPLLYSLASTKKTEIGMKRVGQSVLLVELETGAVILGVTDQAMVDALDQLEIPTVVLGDKPYFNLYALEKALFVGTTYAKGKWVFGKEVPRVEKLWGTKVAFEMGLAALTYSAAKREELTKRVMKTADIIRRRIRRKT